MNLKVKNHREKNDKTKKNTQPQPLQSRRSRSHQRWKQVFSLGSKIGPFGIYSEDFFETLIRYERTRSDRSDSPVTLVTVDVAGSEPSGGVDLETLIETIKKRIRSTDSLGWFGAARIGVLFPGTDVSGAQTFLDALVRDRPALCGRVGLSSHTVSDEAAGDPRAATAGCPDGIEFSDGLSNAVLPPVPRWKRALDVFGSLCGLIALAPLFLFVAVFIKIVSPGPVFFTQDRIGRGGRTFRFIKFRSMHPNNDQNLHAQHAAGFIHGNGKMEKLDDGDPRIFFGGKVLRVSCIDELPQLYNILRGDMSLVGPRPCIPYEAAEYHRWHRHRFDILPGLTGLWQVSGKNKLSFAEMIRLDIKYQRTMSLGLDLWIILRTIPTVFTLIGEAVMRRLKRVHAASSEPADTPSPTDSPSADHR